MVKAVSTGVERREPGKLGRAASRRSWPRGPTGRSRARCARRPAAASACKPGAVEPCGDRAGASLDRLRPRPRRSRRSARRARIRLCPDEAPSLIVATTTTASCFAPREMVKPPRIGQRSTLTLKVSAAASCLPLRPASITPFFLRLFRSKTSQLSRSTIVNSGC